VDAVDLSAHLHGDVGARVAGGCDLLAEAVGVAEQRLARARCAHLVLSAVRVHLQDGVVVRADRGDLP